MLDTPTLDRCLAYQVLTDYRTWLGRPSLQDLSVFLGAAAMRAELLSAEIHEWRIYGPLECPEFYLPLVARTGHPTLTIKWATALEFLYFDIEEAFRDLTGLLEDWQRSAARDPASTKLLEPWYHQPPPDLPSLLRRLAGLPGMFLGSDCGWALRSFLHGMSEGGDWLSLPPLPELQTVIQKIEKRSRKSYGSTFAAYRVNRAAPLLSWADIYPLETVRGDWTNKIL